MSNEASTFMAATANPSTSWFPHYRHNRALVLATVCLGFASFSCAQRVRPAEIPRSYISASAAEAYATLPDAPSERTPHTSSLTSDAPDTPAGHSLNATTPGKLQMAAPTDKYIAPGQPAPKQRVRDKVLLGLKDAASVQTIFAATVAAGISHANNSSPNYGTNSTAYAQRFGAAVARGGSYSIFSDSVLASALHEDPRYYRLGKSHKIVKRLAYAVTRPLISRTDGGHLTPNLSLIGGHLGAAYLTKLYYPPQNTTTGEVLSTFGSSFLGSAIDDGVNEFLSGALNFFHNSRSVKD